jgi:mRNA-degrading endonuclease RelE of RelBE toxin-antitoxin system
MSYTVLAIPEFERDYSKLPREIASRIGKKIEEWADHPEQMRFPLRGVPHSLQGLHKYRVGDYRVLFWPEHENQRIILYAVAHRREIYRHLRFT